MTITMTTPKTVGATEPATPLRRPRRLAARGLPVAAAMLLLSGCAALQTPGAAPGQPRDAVLERWGQPTARYEMPGGGERLEYATGPFGRMTWMIDVDPAGRVVQSAQVLNEAHFASLQARAPGMSRAELLRQLGTPGERQGVGWQGAEVWSWRYPTNDCLWFQVTVDVPVDKVRDAGYGIDPRCDPPTADRN